MSRTIALLMLSFVWISPLALAQQEAIDPRTGAPAIWGDAVSDNRAYTQVLVDRLELRFGEEHDTQAWDIQAWHGDDYNRWWLKTEGEGSQGKQPEHAGLQLLHGWLIAPFWDLQLGLRQDWQPASRTYLTAGIQGVIPYELDADLAIFLSDEGNLSLSAGFEYEWLMTQRLILQPSLELNAALSADPELGSGSGLNDTELGLRLRYEIKRQFAPYLGWSWTRSYGETANLRRANGEVDSEQALVVGVRAWF